MIYIFKVLILSASKTVLQKFLLLEDFVETRQIQFTNEYYGNGLCLSPLNNPSTNNEEQCSSSINVCNIHGKWNSDAADDSLHDTLKNVSFEMKNGECYGICGSVGDGKVSGWAHCKCAYCC